MRRFVGAFRQIREARDASYAGGIFRYKNGRGKTVGQTSHFPWLVRVPSHLPAYFPIPRISCVYPPVESL